MSKHPNIRVIDPRLYSRVPMSEVPPDAPTISLEDYWELCNTARRDAWLAQQDRGALKEAFEKRYPVRTPRDLYGMNAIVPYRRNDLRGAE